ncbi:hypothetical protein [Sporosarcina beigongshangi]|uniref:hypothetical protein n=1 Tax=Sporosarcina beigongshangi TaxID=2782538 RepID=UPI00193AB8E6|nr:hypothetical protein [Sporosarcina beigongshangi]
MTENILDVLRSVIREELQPVKQELQHLNQRMEKVEIRLDNIEIRLEKVETRLDNLENRVGSIGVDLAEVKDKVSAIDARQQILYEQTAKLSEYHAETIACFDQLAMKEDLEYFDKKLGEHDREIFKMKHGA